jgi:hypothetical protein
MKDRDNLLIFENYKKQKYSIEPDFTLGFYYKHAYLFRDTKPEDIIYSENMPDDDDKYNPHTLGPASIETYKKNKTYRDEELLWVARFGNEKIIILRWGGLPPTMDEATQIVNKAVSKNSFND